MPQLQPARMVLLITVMAQMLCLIAAAEGVAAGRQWETFAWLVLPVLIPVHRTVTGDYTIAQILLTLGIAALATLALSLKSIQVPAVIATLLAATFLIPAWSGFVNYPRIHSPELDALCAWARTSTPTDAMFLFPAPGKDLRPGIFRAQSLRAVYADWKAGGQVNYFDDLGREWWRRWQQVTRGEVPAEVNYVVYAAGRQPAGSRVAYQNSEWVVTEPAR